MSDSPAVIIYGTDLTGSITEKGISANPLITSNIGTGVNNAALPSSSILVGGSDGANLQAARVFDVDTSSDKQFVLGVTLRKSALSGSLEYGTSADPFRVDPTGTTTQPVTGSVGITNTVAISAASLPLPSGAAQEHVTAGSYNSSRLTDGSAFYDATKTGQLPSALAGGKLDVNIGTWLGSAVPTTGQKTMSGSIPVVIASDQGAISVSGTIIITDAAEGLNASLAPTSSIQIGGSDGTNLQAGRVFDVDTSSDKQFVFGVTLRKSALSGSLEYGTSADPFRIDPTGTTIQPVNGTVTSNQGSAAILSSAWPIRITDGTVSASISANNALKVDGSAVTQPVSAASLPLPSGAAQEHVTAGSPNSARLSDGSAFYDATKTGQLPTSLAGGKLDINLGTWIGSAVPTTGQKTMSGSIPVVISSDQTALLISGSISATNPSVGTNDSTAPTSTTQIGGSDGTNLQAGRIFDVDTSSDKQYVIGVTLRKSALSGSLEYGTSADPIRVDPTGTTIQPVNGTVTANQGTSAALVNAWPIRITDGTVSASISSNNALKVDGSAVTQPISAASLPLPSGAAQEHVSAVSYNSSRLTDGSAFYDATKTGQLPTSLAGGKLDINLGTWLGSVVPTTGQKTMSGSIPVVISSDQTAILISGSISATNPSVGTNTSTAPTSTTQIGGSDGTNLQAGRVFDVDTSSDTQYVIGVTLRKSALSGSLEYGTSADPIRIDPTGTTTQPVTGSVGITNTVAISAAALPLPAGAAQEHVTAASYNASRLTDGSAFYDATKTGQLPAALAGGKLDVNIGTWIGSAVPTTGQKTMSGSIPVVIASDQSAILISGSISATNPSVGTNASTAPVSSTQIGGSDGTNLQASRVFDVDTSADKQFVLGVTLRKSALSGSLEYGTSADPIRVDPTGTTTQPISAASLPLPAGAAQEHVTAGSPNAVRLSDGSAFYDAVKTGQLPAALISSRLDVNVGSWMGSTVPVVGQQAMSGSIPVVISSNQSWPTVGTHANAWNAAAVAANGVSTAVDCQYTPAITAFGNSSGNTTITIQVSQDNSNFYDASSTSLTGGAADFAISISAGARYVRLKSSAARTITATIAGKG